MIDRIIYCKSCNQVLKLHTGPVKHYKPVFSEDLCIPPEQPLIFGRWELCNGKPKDYVPQLMVEILIKENERLESRRQ